MTCTTVRKKLSGYLDGALHSREHRPIQQHVAVCPSCRARLEEYQRMSTLMSRVNPMAPPADLPVRIRVALSHQPAPRTFLRRTWERAHIRIQNMLEPIALPATGGVLTAMIVFAFMIQALFVGVPLGAVANDQPMNFIQPARLEFLAPFTFSDFEAAGLQKLGDVLIVQATINERGEVVDYEILSGPKDSVTRRSLDQVLMFSRFRPQMSFGRPTSGGRVLLSFDTTSVRG